MNQVEAIEAKLAELYREFEDVKRVYAGTQQRFEEIKRELTALNAAKATALAAELVISDHAVLRYAERVLGLNLSDVAADLNGQVAALALTLGDGKYPLRDAAGTVLGVAVVKNKTVVTVLPV